MNAKDSIVIEITHFKAGPILKIQYMRLVEFINNALEVNFHNSVGLRGVIG